MVPNRRAPAVLERGAAAVPEDKSYANQLRAGEILVRLLASQPDHPGLSYYILHAYDVPALAARGWLDHAAGRSAEALAQLREAAAREEATVDGLAWAQASP